MANYNNRGNNSGNNYNQRANSYQGNNNYQGGGSGNGGYGGGSNRLKKHSGATKGTDKNGKQYYRGWNFSKRRGMLTVFVTSFKSSGEHTAANGNVYTNLMAKVKYNDSGVEKIMGALLSHKSGRVIIPELGMVLNADAPNKGYFGSFTRK